MPLPHARLIHPRWQAHHAPPLVGTMTAQVRLSRPGQLGVRDPATGRTPLLDPETYYTGPGRVVARGGATPADESSGRRLVTAPYLVTVPLHLPETPRLGDLVDVLDSADPAMPTRLVITEIPAASLILQRSLGCDLHTPQRGG